MFPQVSYMYIRTLHTLYSFRVFSYADDAYVMRITLVGGQEKVEGFVAFYSWFYYMQAYFCRDANL